MLFAADHPRAVLLASQSGGFALPVCDHYSGTPARMRKSLQLQADLTQELGRCVVDVTLDCEDGAQAGGDREHAHLVAELALGAAPGQRVAVRVHAPQHPSFSDDLHIIVGRAAGRLSHVMLPKIDTRRTLEQALQAIDAAGGAALPVHALIESPLAVHNAFEIAGHPRVQSLSFGLMDFVSAHGGAVPASAMEVRGQFSHPVVVRAKLAVAAACHAHGKTPSHCVVTEFSDTQALVRAARRAARKLAYTRMWSIHPAQIRPILEAFAPEPSEVDLAVAIIEKAHAAQWAPISHQGVLHDRASYRYYWQVIERAHQSGHALPASQRRWLDGQAEADARPDASISPPN